MAVSRQGPASHSQLLDIQLWGCLSAGRMTGRTTGPVRCEISDRNTLDCQRDSRASTRPKKAGSIRSRSQSIVTDPDAGACDRRYVRWGFAVAVPPADGSIQSESQNRGTRFPFLQWDGVVIATPVRVDHRSVWRALDRTGVDVDGNYLCIAGTGAEFSCIADIGGTRGYRFRYVSPDGRCHRGRGDTG